jgi:hypothetical protein
MLGNYGLASQPAIIDAAVAGGVREFYPSEYGADLDVEPYLSARYFRDKQITRKHLQMKAKETPGFGYTYILTGAITEYLATPFFGVDKEKQSFTFYGEPERKAEFTSIKEYVSDPDPCKWYKRQADITCFSVARYIVDSTLLPRSSEPERRLKCVGGSYTWEEIIDIIQKVQKIKYDVDFRPLEEAKALQNEAAERGDIDAELAWSLRVILGEPEASAVPKPWDNDLFGFKPADLATALGRQFAK